MSKDLIRDYNDKQQAQYASNLEIPKVVAPKLQDATPVNDKQFQVTTPQGQPLEQMVAPTPDKELGMLSNEQLQNPEQNVALSFNDRLSRQLPTLLFGEPTDAERRSNEFYDWVGNQIEDNRKRSAAQAMTIPSLSQYNTPTQTQPNGFGQNVLKGLFGSDKTNASDDGILGNEFDITKGRFGQYGNGAVGGLMYFLDNTLGLGALRNSLMDTAANLSSQAAGWTASGGVLDTLFKTGDVGKSIIAGSNRQKQALRNIYGGETPTSFLIQGLLGRDLGALGNLSGDSHDDYRKLYGSSPIAAGLDRAFFGRSLTEQETKDYEKLTGYSVKQTLDMFAGGENKAFNLTPEEQKDYNEILGRVPEDFKTKMLLRNITGLVSDIKADDLLKPLATIKRARQATDVVVPKLPALEGSPTRLQLPGASPAQRALPPRERMTGAADEYMYNWLRRGEDISQRPVEAPRLGDSTDPWFGAVARGNDPWVTIDATAVRVPDALTGVDNAALPYAKSSPLPPSTPLDSVIGNRTITAMPTQEFINSVNTSAAKALVVSPPIDSVRSPLQESVADVLRQQYMTRVEPGQYILQRLGTIADTDPIIALKSIEPAPRIANPVRLALPPAKLPTQIAGDLQKAFANTEGAKTTQFWYEDKLVQEQIRSGLPSPQSEIKETPRSTLPETGSTLPKDVAKEDVTQPPSKPKEPETASEVPPKEVQEVKPKMIPSSKEELLRKARERLNAEKAQRSGVEQPKAETNDVVVKSEVPAEVTNTKPVEGETPKQRMLREARERLDAEKAQRRLESAVTEGIAKPVDNGVEVRVDLDNPKGQELLNDAIDFDTLFNKTYSFEDLDTMVSMVSRAAAGAPLSFVGKVAPIGEVSRSQKEIYRFASLVPDPMNPGKPLLAPTKSMIAEYAAKYGVEHPYASSAIADSSMKYLTKNGGARRHKSLADLAAEQSNPLYRKILSPTGTPIPLAVIERFEKQISQGGQALVKTSSDTVSAIDTAKPVVDTKSQQMVKRTRTESQKFIDDNKLGIRKNLSADKLNDALTIYESKGLDAVPDEYFTKAGLSARKSASDTKEVEAVKKVEAREKKLETKAKSVVKTETLEDFEDAVVKLEDMEPTIEELERIQKKVSSLPIFDHRKKLSSPSHTDAVVSEAKTNPKIVEKQQRYEELTTQLQEVITQEQELVKTKQAIDIAVDDVDAQQQARVSKFMERYGMARSDAQEFDGILQSLLARDGEAVELIGVDGWTHSRKAAMKDVAQSVLDVNDVRTSPTYESLRQSVVDDGSYEKASAWLYQNSGTKKSTNPVISIDADGNFDFISGSSTFFAAMDSGVERIPVQIVFDKRTPPNGSVALEPVEIDFGDSVVSGLGFRNADGFDVLIKPDVWTEDAIEEILSGYYGTSHLGINKTLRGNYVDAETTLMAESVVEAIKRLPTLSPEGAKQDSKYFNKLWKPFEATLKTEVSSGVLDKVPNPYTEMITLYRGVAGKYFKDVKIGDIVTELGITGTTPSPRIANQFVKKNDTPTMLEIVNHSSGKLSTNPNQLEVLFKDAQYKILNIRQGDGTTPRVLVVEEINTANLNPIEVVKQLEQLPTDTKLEQQPISKTLGDALEWTTTKQGSTNPMNIAVVLDSVDVFNTPVTITQFKNDVSGYEIPSVKPWYSKKQERLQLNVYPLEALKDTYSNPLVKTVVDSYKRGGMKAAVDAYIDSKTTNPATGKRKPFNLGTSAADEDYIPKDLLKDVVHEIGGILRLIPYLEDASAARRGSLDVANKYIVDDGLGGNVEIGLVAKTLASDVPGDISGQAIFQKALYDVLNAPSQDVAASAFMRLVKSADKDLAFVRATEASTGLFKKYAELLNLEPKKATLSKPSEKLIDEAFDTNSAAELSRFLEKLFDGFTFKMVDSEPIDVTFNLASSMSFINTIEKHGVEPLDITLARKVGADVIRLRHGDGETMSTYNVLREILDNPSEFKGHSTYLLSCQSSCERYASPLIPTSYVLDWRSENPKFFNALMPDVSRQLSDASIQQIKNGEVAEPDLTLSLRDAPDKSIKHVNLDDGNVHTPSVIREQLSRQNISDSLRMANSQGGAVDEVLTQVPSSQQLNVRKRRDPNAALPTTVGQAVREFKDGLAQVNRTGVLDDRTQIKLNNAVFAMESLDDKSYAKKMREVVARLTGRTADEGKPFMSAAVELLNDPARSWSREQIADILSYAIGTKDVKFAQNLDDAEVLKFGRLVAQRPEIYSQFDHVYVGHGTGIVEHGSWSLEARPSTGYRKRELIQHVIDNEYPRGTEVGVSACETGCPKRVQDAVPPMHRVVSRGAVGSTLDNLQRLVEELSALPVPTKIMDVFAQYDGLLREAMSANKQRSLEILQEMSDIEDDFNVVSKKYKFKSEQQVRAKMKQAQDAIEKDLLGDC